MIDIEPAVNLLTSAQPALLKVLAFNRIPPEDREDILQDALLAAWRRWSEIQDPKAWLMGTIRHMCAIYWRKRRECPVDPVPPEILVLLSEPQAGEQEARAAASDLNRLLLSLPVRFRRVLVYRYLLGLSVEEVAATLGYQPASVRKVAGRAAARIQTAYAATAISRNGCGQGFRKSRIWQSRAKAQDD